jgi:hypothetical protein
MTMLIRGKNFALALFCAGLLNFALFVAGSLWLGGDAVNGKIEQSQFYVGGKGEYTAVSQGIWVLSYVHVVSVWVTFPVGMIAGAIYFGTRHGPTNEGRPATHDGRRPSNSAK